MANPLLRQREADWGLPSVATAVAIEGYLWEQLMGAGNFEGNLVAEAKSRLASARKTKNTGEIAAIEAY
jgi:hypothetical protein